MSSESKRILCATNLSNDFNHVLHDAIALAKQNGAKVILFHVLDPRSVSVAKTLGCFFNENGHDIMKAKTDAAIQQMKNQLQTFYKTELKNHPEYAGRVEYLIVHPGKVAVQIAEKADRFECDAIVIGPRGKSLFTKLFRGNTAKQVRKRTRKPVHVAGTSHLPEEVNEH